MKTENKRKRKVDDLETVAADYFADTASKASGSGSPAAKAKAEAKANKNKGETKNETWAASLPKSIVL